MSKTETIFRTVGDHGELARIRILGLRDYSGQAVVSGSVRLRAGGLFDRPMTHLGDGNWYLDPVVGDLDRPGRFLLEVLVEGSQVTVPGRAPWRLNVRTPVADPS